MKKTITIILTALLFCAFSALGIDSVFRVEDVALEINVVSEDAKTEAQSLKRELLSIYEKNSIFSVDEKGAEEVLADFPYFRLTNFSKDYPNKLVVEVTEDAEVFAIQSQDEYYILGLDGTVLSKRTDPNNRSDGRENVFIEGVTVLAEKGEVCKTESIMKALPFLKTLSNRFNGLRSNIVKIVYEKIGSNEQYTLYMREGLKIYVMRMDEFTTEKGDAIADAYLSMSDPARLSGSLFVTNTSEKVTIQALPNDLPENS